MDGCELVRRVRAEASCGGRVFIGVYSGHAKEAAVRSAGADGFVLKPDIDALEALIRSASKRTSVERRNG